jgi:hypothetical protein
MTTEAPRSATRVWRAARFILIDWTVTPRMLALNERRPIVYQLVTTPIVTLVFGSVRRGCDCGLKLAGDLAVALKASVRFPPIADTRSPSHSPAMRTALATAVLIAAAACRPAEQEQQRWQYRQPAPGYVARVDYVFGDSASTRFVGRCDGEPVFMLAGGDYPLGSTKFTLIVDGQSWELPAFQGEHGRLLIVEAAGPQSAITKAKRLIAFRVGNWQRQFRPGPLLQRFAEDCG